MYCNYINKNLVGSLLQDKRVRMRSGVIEEMPLDSRHQDPPFVVALLDVEASDVDDMGVLS